MGILVISVAPVILNPSPPRYKMLILTLVEFSTTCNSPLGFFPELWSSESQFPFSRSHGKSLDLWYFVSVFCFFQNMSHLWLNFCIYLFRMWNHIVLYDCDSAYFFLWIWMLIHCFDACPVIQFNLDFWVHYLKFWNKCLWEITWVAFQ